MFKKFNPLKVLRMDSHEIRHSNILAWLLDHEENHGLNSVFVEKIISKMLMKPQNNSLITDSEFFLQILGLKFADWKVEREKQTSKKRYIDLLLSSEDNKTVIIIENKFYSSQSANQLNDYLNYVETEYPGYTIIPVFLTLLDEEPANELYWTLNYADVANVLEFILQFYKESISEEVFVFLKNYLAVLHERFAPDPERLLLAEEIFESYGEAITYLYLLNNPGIKFLNHHQPYKLQLKNISGAEEEWMRKAYQASKEAIDFIYTEGSLTLKKAFERFIVEDNQKKVLRFDASKSSPSFTHPEWEYHSEILERLTDKAPYWLKLGLIIFLKRAANNRLNIIIEVGNLEYDIRLKLLHYLEQNGYSIKPSSKSSNSMYTRIFSDQVEVKDWTSVDQVHTAIEQLTNSDQFESNIKRINNSVKMLAKELSE
ncbi:PD-(D/E)XK nuclease family protein [Planococcus shenhongbingii]|uniref:PDDEXK-like family protein n=1 Tax=Planococcus shenhongbingii TaxID=3058398 RepID=UPI002630D088|nr:PD-(D/E)XK nuclease family protein [Planococcus sp. N016]WKA56975.1 PD-(D/E)XK nuclease family protein [Planococcus sp. N016]